MYALAELQAKGPASFDDAKVVEMEFCRAAQVALLAASDREIDGAIQELFRWGRHLKARRRLIVEEAKRLERVPRAALLVEISLTAKDQ